MNTQKKESTEMNSSEHGNKNTKNFSITFENDTSFILLFGAVTIEHSENFKGLFDVESHLKSQTESGLATPEHVLKTIELNLSQITSSDSYLILIISKFRDYCISKSISLKLSGASDELERFLNVLLPTKSEKKVSISKQPFIVSYISNIGEQSVMLYRDTLAFVEFIGDMLLKIFNLFTEPTDIRWKDFPFHYMRVGVNAWLLVCLILFLVGLITGYQSAVELKAYGADNFIADIIGISITRELAPLMTAILVAGRSGSAFAAELGTMKVNEEIDALHSLGFDTIKFLVLPRVLAVSVSMPVLTAFADLAGIAGGCISALNTLNITLMGFINKLSGALNYFYVFSGIGKSILFGFLLATVGCFRGLQVSGGPESVGKYTTSAVVSGVFLIILSDAVLTLLFQVFGV